MEQHSIEATGPTPLWDTYDVASFLNVSASWVEKNRERIPHIRLGRRVLYAPTSVVAFAKTCERNAA